MIFNGNRFRLNPTPSIWLPNNKLRFPTLLLPNKPLTRLTLPHKPLKPMSLVPEATAVEVTAALAVQAAAATTAEAPAEVPVEVTAVAQAAATVEPPVDALSQSCAVAEFVNSIIKITKIARMMILCW
jgi:hypothetical protein